MLKKTLEFVSKLTKINSKQNTYFYFLFVSTKQCLSVTYSTQISRNFNYIHIFCIVQDLSSLPAILELEDSELNDEVKEKVRASVQCFLQVKYTKLIFIFYRKLRHII